VALRIEKTRGPAALAPTRPSAPSTGYLLKRLLLGRPLATERLAHERLGKPTAMAVFSSDNMSSVAYALPAPEDRSAPARPASRPFHFRSGSHAAHALV
jgi:hypothetical protein